MSNPTITADDVLNLLISIDVTIDTWTKITPSTYIAHSLSITTYQARKLIKELKDRGLVQSAMESCYSDWDECNIIVRGYVLTDKARHLQKWHEANIKELRTMADCFRGLDMDSAIKAAEEAAERDKHHE